MSNNFLFTPTGSGSGGGGGGGSIIWNDNGSNAPVLDFENNVRVYLFDNALAQELYTTVKIPQGYTSGSPIRLYVTYYTASTSNNVLLKTQATLIRANVTAIDATTNQRTSTIAAVTNGSPANRLNQTYGDLTDSVGAINSQSVAAGDTIIVRLYRDTDTDTATVRFLPDDAEVTLTT